MPRKGKFCGIHQAGDTGKALAVYRFKMTRNNLRRWVYLRFKSLELWMVESAF